MTPEIVVRRARPEDAPAMARIHVSAWQETYRGLMPDESLDNPGLIPARERMWTAALTDERWAANRVAVAESAGSLIGIAMSGPTDREPWSRHLHVLYLLAEHQGSGAGSALLRAVIAPDETAGLWVADPNPRARAFYRKHGFVADGVSRVEDGVREIRMVQMSGKKPSGTAIPTRG